MGGFGRLLPCSDPESAEQGSRVSDRIRFEYWTVWEGFGSAEQARAKVEPRAAAGAWGGVGD